MSGSFRRTLVGLKPLRWHPSLPQSSRFRRTLVGLKLRAVAEVDGSPCSFRRTLVGLKLEYRDHRGRHSPVSDEPSWG